MVEIQAPWVVIAAVDTNAATKQTNSADYPEIARNHIANPSDVARQLLNRPVTVRQRHHKQTRFYRPHEVRRGEPCSAADETRFDWNFSRAGCQNQFFKRILLVIVRPARGSTGGIVGDRSTRFIKRSHDSNDV